MSGNSTHGTYVLSKVFTPSDPSATWQIYFARSISATQVILYTNDIIALGWPVNWNVLSNFSRSPPVITSFVVSPSLLDVRNSTDINYIYFTANVTIGPADTINSVQIYLGEGNNSIIIITE